MAAVSTEKGLTRGSGHKRYSRKWYVNKMIAIHLPTYRNLVDLALEFNLSIPQTIVRVTQHFMFCTGRKRGNYRNGSSIQEDYMKQDDQKDLEVPSIRELRRNLMTLKPKNMESVDNQLKSIMEKVT